MKKIQFFIGVVIVLIIGIFIGRLTDRSAKKELTVSMYDPNYPTNMYEFIRISDHKEMNESLIDDFITLLIIASDIEDVPNVNHVDYSYRLYSSKQGYTLTVGDIWLMEDGTAIFGRFKEDQEKIEHASQISVEDTNTLKKILHLK